MKNYACSHIKCWSSFIKSFVFIVPLISIAACSEQQIPISEERNVQCDMYVNSIDTILNPQIDQYESFISDRIDFSLGTQYNIEGWSEGMTKSYIDSKSYVLFDDSFKNNCFMGFIVDNQYGIEKNALFNYEYHDDNIVVTVSDYEGVELFDFEINTISGEGTVIKVYDIPATKGINGCNAAIYAAGATWSTAFGMVNPIAGLLAGACFWVLENYICEAPTKK